MKRLLVVLVCFALLVSSPGFVFAQTGAWGNDVEPQAQIDGSLRFVPNVADTNELVTVKAVLEYDPVVGVSYEYFDLLVDGRLAKPAITATNLSGASFQYESHNAQLNGPAWRARVGFWTTGGEMYLEAVTRASTTGSYRARLGGGPGYLPQPYPYSATLYVN